LITKVVFVKWMVGTAGGVVLLSVIAAVVPLLLGWRHLRTMEF